MIRLPRHGAGTARGHGTGDTEGMTSMDLNAALGEGFGRWALTDDEGLLAVRRHQPQPRLGLWTRS